MSKFWFSLIVWVHVLHNNSWCRLADIKVYIKREFTTPLHLLCSEFTLAYNFFLLLPSRDFTNWIRHAIRSGTLLSFLYLIFWHDFKILYEMTERDTRRTRRRKFTFFYYNNFGNSSSQRKKKNCKLIYDNRGWYIYFNILSYQITSFLIRHEWMGDLSAREIVWKVVENFLLLPNNV